MGVRAPNARSWARWAGVALALAVVGWALAAQAARRPATRASRRAPPTRRAEPPREGIGLEALGPPRFDLRDRAVHWPPGADFLLAADDRRILDDLRAARSPRDSIAVWLGAGERDSLIQPFGRIEAARIALGARDSAGADALLESAMTRSSPWRWAACRQRARLALARSGPAAADSILVRAPAQDLDGVERQELAEDRFDLLLQLGDTTRAVEIARQSLTRQSFFGLTDASPGVAGNAVRLETRLESVLRARGERPGWGDEMKAAEADRAVGNRAGALARLERAVQEAPPEARWRLARERARVLGAARRFDLARDAFAQAEALAPDSLSKGQVVADWAHFEIDARGWHEADRLIADLAAWPDERIRRYAPTLRARTLQSQGEWASAAEAYAIAWRNGPGAPYVAFQAGLLSLAEGNVDSALVWFGRSRTGGMEGPTFWQGVLLRRARDPAGDSLLATIANRPGYSFYAVAARETLGLRGWPGDEVEPPARDSSELRIASLLYALGREAEGRALIPLWDGWARRQRLMQAEIGDFYPVARELLRAAGLAYSSKSEAYAIILSEAAFGVANASPPAVPWRFVPWLYPPAYERAFASWPDSSADGGIDRALLRSVARKESHFAARARSPSNALGLLQLKLGTAADAARALRQRRPRERDLFDPARNVRLGGAYLGLLLRRFGSVPRALAAYNAGPAALARWLALWERAPGRAIGGSALECELTCREETIRYVKEILAARQAYRELRPTTAP